MTLPQLPSDGPGRLIRVDDAAYDQALKTVVALTGQSHAEAEWLLQGVFAAVMLAPPTLRPNPPAPADYQAAEPPDPTDCPWGYLMPGGRLLLCDGMESEDADAPEDASHPEPGYHQTIGAPPWHESHPRTVNVREWNEASE